MKLTQHIYLIGSGEFGLSHPMDCSVYLVDVVNEIIMIDSGVGYDVDALLRNCKRDGIDLEKRGLTKVLLTHGHADHAGGAYELQKRYGCAIYMGKEEVEAVEKGDEKALGLDVAKRSGIYPLDYKFKSFKVSVPLKHNEDIRAGEFVITALNVPGHSPGSICYFVELPEGRTLFTGDVVFPGGVLGLLNCPGSSLASYRRFLHRLRGLDVDILLPGHRGFVLKGGQTHIDLALEKIALLHVPPSFM